MFKANSRSTLLFAVLIFLAACAPRGDNPGVTQDPTAALQPIPASAPVSAVEVLTADGRPAQIRILVRGTLPDGCADLTEPQINRQGYRFNIDLAVISQNGQGCAGQPKDYEKIIPLDLSGLPAGDYTISVNASTATYAFAGESLEPPAAAEPVAPTAPRIQTEDGIPVTAGQPAEGPQPVEAAPRGCTDVAAFYDDVTIPDNTPFEQNTPFVKTWAIRNEGTCTWDANYALVFAGGDPMSGSLSVPLPETQPGGIMNVSIDLVSPPQGGQYTGYYEFINSEGKRFGVNSGGIDKIWVTISVRWYKPGESEPSAGVPSADMNTTCAFNEDPNYVSQLLGLINQARADQGLGALELNSRLSAAALKHSVDMGCQGFLGHVGSDGSTFGQRVKAEGYTYSYVSENIYAGSPDFGGNAQGAFDWWMNSTVHRNNILSNKVNQIGIGFALVPGSPYGGYYTLNFARP
jgi:uncharacterized protein YkwD